MSEAPQLSDVYESLAESVEGWAAGLDIHLTYTDPRLEECGRRDWAVRLRKDTDWAVRTAVTLLTARSKANLADDLSRRMDELLTAADSYEQRLDALEDQRRIHIEGIVSRYRQAFGDEDPDAHRLMQLCQGINRVWTLRIVGYSPETPEDFAEAIDRVLFEEDGAKRRAQAEVKRLATELAQHVRMLAQIEAAENVQVVQTDLAGQNIQAIQAVPAMPEPEKKVLRGKRGPGRMSLSEAWRYLTVVQEWATIQECNRTRDLRDRVRKVQLAEKQNITVQELDSMLAWYAKYQRQGCFPKDPRTLSKGELEKWFE